MSEVAYGVVVRAISYFTHSLTYSFTLKFEEAFRRSVAAQTAKELPRGSAFHSPEKLDPLFHFTSNIDAGLLVSVALLTRFILD
ncbi:MAG TPA: hypothetical protein VF639_00375 [Hymenobacter sp.]|jgi:hypothetical protein